MLMLALLLYAHLVPRASGLVLEDDVGRLPALGWNSWNAYHCEITESQFIVAANKFIDLGLKDAGYEYVNIDDCWSVRDGRDSVTDRLIPDPVRFPDGINGTAKKIHDLGLKIGIYSSAGTMTCAGYPASIGHEAVDAETWAEWGIDYLKYDNCFPPQNWTDECRACNVDDFDPKTIVNGSCTDRSGVCPSDYDYSSSNTAKRYNIMRDALLAQNRTILYSLCEWGQAGVAQWGNSTASSWRMSNDIESQWPRILDLLNQNSFLLHSVDFWGHPDADMLEVGNGGLTLQQSRTHFAFWAAMKSPLLIGTDLATLGQGEVEVLKNKYLLAFSQDANVGKPAMPYKWGTNPDWTFNASYPAEYWSGASSNGTLVLLFNPHDQQKNKTAPFEEVPELKGAKRYHVIDIWTGEDKGCLTGEIAATVDGHDTAGFLVGASCGSENGRLAPLQVVQELLSDGS